MNTNHPAQPFIPKGVTEIEKDAFSCNTVITKAIIPYGLTRIGEGAFECCPGLKERNFLTQSQ